jgi:hypothetical protein
MNKSQPSREQTERPMGFFELAFFDLVKSDNRFTDFSIQDFGQ